MKKGDVICMMALEDEQRRLVRGEWGIALYRDQAVGFVRRTQQPTSYEYMPCSFELIPASEWLTKEQIDRLRSENEELRGALQECVKAMEGIERWCGGGLLSGHRAKVWNYIGDRLARARSILKEKG